MSTRALAELSRPFLATVLLFDEADSAARPSASELARELGQQLDTFEQSAQAAGLHGDEIKEASFALCAWADEVVLGDRDRQNDWMGQQLQLTRFGAHDGGDQFYARLERLRPDFHAARWIYALCLAFGFRGRLGREEAQRAQLLRNALTDIETVDAIPTGALSPLAYRIEGDFVRPTVVGFRHILARWGAVLALVFLAFAAVLAIFVSRVPGGG